MKELYQFNHTKLYKSEDAKISDGCVISMQGCLYTGNSYLEFKGKESYARWTIEVDMEGDYSLLIKYMNRSKEMGSFQVDINEESLNSVNLMPCDVTYYTKGERWTDNWKVARIHIYLKKGKNSIQIKLASENYGYIALDNIAITDGNLSMKKLIVYDVKDYGAVGDGKTIDTKAIQRTVDDCMNTGGMVYIHDGTYLTGSIKLGSNMTIYIEETASLMGSTNTEDYPVYLPTTNTYIQEYKPGFKALLMGLDCENLTITGGGNCNVQGDYEGWIGHEYERPIVVCLISCKNSFVTNIDLTESGSWTFILLECDHVIIDGINVDTRNHINRDGIDPVDSSHIYITNSSIISGDDSICPKSGTYKGVSNLHVKNVALNSGGANGIKFGSSSYQKLSQCTFEDIVMTHCNLAGISLGVSDGADVKDIYFNNIKMNYVRVPVSILNGGGIRGRRIDGSPEREGMIENIKFMNMTAFNVINNYGSHIDGVIKNGKVHIVKDIAFKNIHFTYPGGYEGELPSSPPEYQGEYPDYYWCEPTMPAYGIYVRHANNVTFENCIFDTIAKDSREAIIMEDII